MKRRALLLAIGLAVVRPSLSGAAVTERNLRFTMQISNPLDRALEQQSVWWYGPMRQTVTQQLLAIDASMPHEVSFDGLGQSIVKVPLPVVAPLATRIVNFSARVSLFNEPSIEPLAQFPVWLGEERHVEISDPAIQTLARELRRDNELETARAIYDWVRLNLEYDRYRADVIGAREALRIRRGDCTEYAYLSTALARANQIPARVVGGYVAARDGTPRAGEYHNWAQFHLTGTWRSVDAQLQRWWDTRDYVVFHVAADFAQSALGGANRFRATSLLRVSMP